MTSASSQTMRSPKKIWTRFYNCLKVDSIMKLNKVDTSKKNEAMLLLIEDYTQVITLDANFFILPDRSDDYATSKFANPFKFDIYKKFWLEPLVETFPYLALHEAVYDELIDKDSKDFVKEQVETKKTILLFRD